MISKTHDMGYNRRYPQINCYDRCYVFRRYIFLSDYDLRAASLPLNQRVQKLLARARLDSNWLLP